MPSRRARVHERHPALDVARFGEADLDPSLMTGERLRRVPRLLVVLAPHLVPVLAKGVLDGLEGLAGVAAKELVREDLADPHGRFDAPLAPVLVHELADERLGVRAAEDLQPVLLVPERPENQHVLEPLDRGTPFGDDALDVRAPAAFEPLGRVPAVRADESVGDGAGARARASA